jgi:general secretion pathway protein D
VLVPHIVRGAEYSPLNLRRIDTGAGQSIELRHTSLSDGKPAPVRPATGTAQARPDSASAQGFGPLKGQTAAAAADSAMAQLRQGTAADVPPVTPPVTPTPPQPTTSPTPPSPVSFSLTTPTSTPAVGTNFPMAVTLSGGKDISSVPMQIRYDASKLALVNVDSGDLLTKDGQAVALVHRDDGPGMITIAVSRPPGSKGVTGSGSVCVLTFQAKAPGESDVVITRPGALDSAQKPIAASAQNAHIVVH